MTEPDTGFLARTCERILIEQRSMRDDMRVMFAMIQRLDGTMAALLEEMRAIHEQVARINERIRRFEVDLEAKS